MSKANWKHVTTLRGMSIEEKRRFSLDNIKYFFKVSLWDKSHLCGICLKDIASIESATLDHILPRSLGGRTRLANLQLAHKRCNGNKSNNLPKGLPHNWRYLMKGLDRYKTKDKQSSSAS